MHQAKCACGHDEAYQTHREFISCVLGSKKEKDLDSISAAFYSNVWPLPVSALQKDKTKYGDRLHAFYHSTEEMKDVANEVGYFTKICIFENDFLTVQILYNQTLHQA